MDRPFDIQMDKLKTKLFKMCSLVDEQVDYAIKSIEEWNKDYAKIVIDRDSRVDKFDDKIDRICQKLFALTQPVAVDLRFIMSSLRINANLERIGDLSVNIARKVLDIKEKPKFLNKIDFKETARMTRYMIKNSIDSFINSDADIAKLVLNLDDKLDDLVHDSIEKLITEIKNNPQFIEDGIRFYSIFQEMERLGDHATNIGEEVYFIVKAESIRHRTDDSQEDYQSDLD